MKHIFLLFITITCTHFDFGMVQPPQKPTTQESASDRASLPLERPMEPLIKGQELQNAVRKGNESLVERLLKIKNIHVNYQNNLGTTPLMEAVALGKPKIVNLLLAAGANPHLADAQGTTPLMQAALQGNIEITKALLNAGASLDLQDAHGATALMYAILWPHPEIVAILLAAGANPDLKDKTGKTAHDWVLRKKHRDVTKLPTINQQLKEASAKR